MRLWHEKMIPNLSKKHLLGQHRECCALRGNGWNQKHKTVDYVFDYNPIRLIYYHFKVMEELEERGVDVTQKWWDEYYRGKNCESWDEIQVDVMEIVEFNKRSEPVFPEHDLSYFGSCVENLRKKGFDVEQFEEVLEED